MNFFQSGFICDFQMNEMIQQSNVISMEINDRWNMMKLDFFMKNLNPMTVD